MLSLTESAALAHAFAQAESALAGYDPNPRVGCAVLAADGHLAAVAGHAGAGSPHAEVLALSAAGQAARGGTAIVTLQPCNHQGRTAPCVDALIEAGIARVVYAVADPSGHAAESDARLRAAGIEVLADVDPASGNNLLGSWGFAQRHHRPYVTWKVAATLDGRIADQTGSSKWITGESARRDVHELRARMGAVITSTGTIFADNPRLNARTAREDDAAAQPLRVALGLRSVPQTANIASGAGEFLQIQSRNLSDVMRELHWRGVHAAMLECGPTLAAAALDAGIVDEVLWYVAGVLLGTGQPAAAITAPLAHAVRWQLLAVRVVGDDVVMHWQIPNAVSKGA